MLPALSLHALALFAICRVSFADEDFHGDHWTQNNIIQRDVLIIGGGSSGTYSAIRLKQQGKSVVVVEKQSVLGGHTNTYIDPVTGAPVDYGVQTWEDIPVVRSYFNYLNVPLTTNTQASPSQQYFADYSAGVVVPESALPQVDVAGALQTYSSQLAKYPWLFDGYNLPNPIPDDLLLPFGSFVQKYNLQAMASIAFDYGQGLGNVLAVPTLYIMKLINPDVIAGIENGFLTSAVHNNHALYDEALAKLGSDALLNSQAEWIERGDNGIRAAISTPAGRKLVKAKRLLIAIPQKLDFLTFLDLDEQERYLFSQWNSTCYWSSVIRNSGIPDNASVIAFSLSAPDNIPAVPVLYAITASGIPGLHVAYYGSASAIPVDQVKANILSNIAEVVKVAGFPPAPGPATFAAFSDHCPFEVRVSVDAIKARFYDQVNDLQGKRSTWYTGAAWQSEDSSQIWDWFERRILSSLLK